MYVKLLFVVLCSAVAAQVQFCHVDEAFDLDLCIALSTLSNQTSNEIDLYLTFSGRFDNGRGWNAFGIGDRMDGALMLVLYPGLDAKDLVLSVRSTQGHYPPKALEEQPDIRVQKAYTDANGYRVAEIICYSCNAWHDPSRWIWSGNDNQPLQTNDQNAQLHLHKSYGKFQFDTSRAVISDETSAFPPLKNRHNIGVITGKQASINSVTKAVHGIFLSAAFLLLFPVGAIIIRSRQGAFFRLHRIFQLLGASFTGTGAVFGIWHAWQNGVESTILIAHVTAGMTLVTAICLQIWTGWRHHQLYLLLQRRTHVSYVHMWGGRLILLGGIVNVSLGSYAANGSFSKFYLWVIPAAFAALMVYLYYWYTSREQYTQDKPEGLMMSAVDSEDEEP